MLSDPSAAPRNNAKRLVSRVGQLQVLTRRPLLQQGCRRIFVTESRHCLLEAATEKHGGPNLNHRRFDGHFVVLNAYIVAYSVTMCNYICL